VVDLVDSMNARAVRAPVQLATVAALPAYTRVGSVLTANANGAIPAIDSVAVVVGMRVLVQHVAAAADAGVYDVTSVGAAGAPWVLTRSSDFAAGDVVAGAVVGIEQGAILGNSLARCTSAAAAAVIGTHAPAWSVVVETLGGLIPTARAAAIAPLPLYTVTGNFMVEDVAAAGFPALDGGAVVVEGELFWLTGGANPEDNGPWLLVAAGGALDEFVCCRPRWFLDGAAILGQRGRILEGTLAAQEVAIFETAGVVGTDPVTVIPAHGFLAAAGANDHDSGQIANLSDYGGGTVTAALGNAINLSYNMGSRVVSGGQGTDGANLTIAVYEIDMTECIAAIAGTCGAIAALNDQDLLDPLEIESYQLDGSQAVALTADGQTYRVALVAIVVAGVVELRAVFGAEAADGLEVAPTAAQIQTALITAAIVDHEDELGGVIINRLRIQRVAVDTITYTWETITDAAPLNERAYGRLLTWA
jgi:hypothetical protein